MKITIKHKDLACKGRTQIGRRYDISVNLYNRHDCLGIDFDSSQGQIILDDISINQAKRMITELTDYISSKENETSRHNSEKKKGIFTQYNS